MARGAAQAGRKRAQQDVKPKKAKAAPSWEDQLFFSRLRRHAKVVYVLLAVIFAGGFVFLGVGSGSGGIGDLLQGNFFGNGGSSTSFDRWACTYSFTSLSSDGSGRSSPPS